MRLSKPFGNLQIINNQNYKDNRGYFKEILKENLIRKKFPFVVMSFSKKNVLRGLHLQLEKPQGKYISVLKGKIFDVAVDLRKGSKTFGKHFSTILSEQNSNSLYIPPGFAHGFLCISKENYIIYSCSNYRHKKSEIGIDYNDPHLKIKWPGKKFILSSKDRKNISFKDFVEKYI